MEHQMLSLADQVFEVIERDILIGTYERGEILTENHLSEQLGVSRTPVREALKRLTQEHLVEPSGKGMKVIGVSSEDIQDIYEIRYHLEGLVAKRVAQNVTEEGLKALRDALELQGFYTNKGDADGVKNMDSEFHRQLYLLCGSSPLRYSLEPLVMRIVKYRKASLSIPARAQKSLEEHWAIYKAIEQRNADLAEELTRQHVRAACEHILEGKKD